MGSSRPSVTERVLSILGAFSPGRTVMSLAEISRQTGLPAATAHRLLGELTRWGALERDDDGLYRVGLRLWEVGALAPRGLGLREAAMPFLEDLYEATHENVQLAVLDGLEVLYVERIAGRDAVHVFTQIGLRFPAHATGVGLALLAHAHPDVQERAITGPLRRFTPRRSARRAAPAGAGRDSQDRSGHQRRPGRAARAVGRRTRLRAGGHRGGGRVHRRSGRRFRLAGAGPGRQGQCPGHLPRARRTPGTALTRLGDPPQRLNSIFHQTESPMVALLARRRKSCHV